MIESIDRFRKSAGFSFFMTAIALVGFIVGVLGYLYSDKPRLTIEELSNTSVLKEVNNLSELGIKYKGITIPKEAVDLHLMTVKIANDGDADIRKSDYDENALVTLAVKGGRLLDYPELIEEKTSSNYLKENVSVTVDSSRTIVILPAIILGSGDFYTLKLLVLSPRDSVPFLIPHGKIAGVDKVKLRKNPYDSHTFRQSIDLLSERRKFALVLAVFFFFFMTSFLSFLVISGWIDSAKTRRWIKDNWSSYNAHIRALFPNYTDEERESLALRPQDMLEAAWKDFKGDEYPNPLFESRKSGLLWTIVTLVVVWTLVELIFLAK